MSKFCPITKSYVVYLECLDCDEKLCENNKKDTGLNTGVNVNKSKSVKPDSSNICDFNKRKP